MEKKKKKQTIRIVSRVMSVIALFVMAFFLVFLYKLNVLPMKYFALICAVLALLEAIYLFFTFNKKMKTGILVFLDVIAVIAMAVEGFGAYKLYQTDRFLEEDMQVTETKDYYYIAVNKDSKFNELKDIEGKFVYYYNDNEDYETIIKNVKAKVAVVLEEVTDYSALLDDVLTNKNKIILIDEGSYDAYFEQKEEESGNHDRDNVRILEKFEIVSKLEISDSKKDITKEPFIIYLSGIDTRSNSMPKKSLSDVNMYLVVNPKTRQILMVSVPRDYYVQLHGTKGLKDKLTHAGMRGGIKLSKSTMEDLLGYKADYYVRVNFNAVINLVDAIGGITINNDLNHSFSCWTDRGCVFKPGKNKVGGRCALAFARERHAYISGDRHRGENQQQVIQLIVNKLTSSKSLIKNYDKILKALKGSFESNLSTDNITSLVQFQLNDMRGWNFSTKNLDGPTGMTACYSFPKSKLSVMYQNEKTIEAAKKEIKKVLGK